MITNMLGLLAETPVHPGTGRSVGVIDLPVAREAATDYPVLVASSLKGALRDHVERCGNDLEVDDLFGKPDQAGKLLISDGRLLLLPVRSLTGAYRWVTCPHILERYRRDQRRAGMKPNWSFPEIQAPHHALGPDEGALFLEEREFKIDGNVPDDVCMAIMPLIAHEETRRRLGKQMVVLHNEDFAWFARYALTVQARNALKDDTKKSENLWYEESLPPDTLMYALITGRDENATKNLKTVFADRVTYLQAGGNETIGHGWFAACIAANGTGGDQ